MKYGYLEMIWEANFGNLEKAAEIIGVSRRKIYKWGYDRKSKPKYKSESTVGLESQFNWENMG